jgi:hypothetical protein
MRTCSRTWPRMRFSSASMYTTMSGSSGMAFRLSRDPRR